MTPKTDRWALFLLVGLLIFSRRRHILLWLIVYPFLASSDYASELNFRKDQFNQWWPASFTITNRWKRFCIQAVQRFECGQHFISDIDLIFISLKQMIVCADFAFYFYFLWTIRALSTLGKWTWLILCLFLNLIYPPCFDTQPRRLLLTFEINYRT